MAVTGIAAITARGVVLAIAEIVIQLALQGGPRPPSWSGGPAARRRRPPVRARSVSSRSTCSSAADRSAPAWSRSSVTPVTGVSFRLRSYTVKLESCAFGPTSRIAVGVRPRGMQFSAVHRRLPAGCYGVRPLPRRPDEIGQRPVMPCRALESSGRARILGWRRCQWRPS